MNRYQQLDPVAVGLTIDQLIERIAARFPDRQLVQVAREVRTAVDRVAVAKSSTPTRKVVRAVCMALAILVAVVTVVALVYIFRDPQRRAGATSSIAWPGVIESAVNDLVFAGIAIAFLVTVTNRLDRRAMLSELHRLRSLAHVIDMHQLTKDPERYLSQPAPTSSSVSPGLDAVQLGRYLDYCSELLSHVSKTAALYAQMSTDSLVLETVSEIESLTNGLSRKIWQKISLLHAG